MRRTLLILACGLTARLSPALGPHEVLLLANRNSEDSVGVAREYAAMRRIPDANLVILDIPAGTGLEISPADFSKRIWEPAAKAVRERGLEDHILAWVYSVDFPVRIRAEPPLSLVGLTFLRNRMPEAAPVEKGLYASPLFAGPDHPKATGFPAQSLDASRAWLGKDMPLPAMMLGYTGTNGNTREEALACLRRGVQADGTRPAGTVYFVTNNDVRSLCRQWQFPAAIRELQEQEVEAQIATAPPGAGSSILGIMMGAADVPMEAGRTFVPGAMAEHLTSFGAEFERPEQTKITAWIRAGATASAGAVAEPFSAWTKFPHARFFVHLAAGCTILESFYQSIRCPLQVLLIGEPLAAPWSPASALTVRGLESGELDRLTLVEAVVAPRNGETFTRFLFLMDGRTLRPAGTARRVLLDPAALEPGRHTLRAVAYGVGPVRGQLFAEQTFTVRPAR